MDKKTEMKYEPQILQGAKLKEAKRDVQTMKDLDKMATPLEVKVYGGNSAWTYRNKAYRHMLEKMDSEALSQLEKLVIYSEKQQTEKS